MQGFAVNLSGAGTGATGVIQVDQLTGLDMVSRKGKPNGDKVPDVIMDDVLARIATFAQ